MSAPAVQELPAAAAADLALAEASSQPAATVLGLLGSGETGLTAPAAAERLSRFGPNAIVSHRARLWPVLWHQLKSPLLGLLAIAAIASYFVGERSDAVIIGVILALSVGMGFLNEYRAEKAAEALHSQIRHRAIVLRDGQPASVDVTELVPGDVVELSLGDVIPADMRLLVSSGLECDESILTGESMPAEKEPDAVPAGTELADLTDCALMGTVVRAGSGRGVVVATGAQAEFGRIAVGLGAHQMETEFQAGLRRFSVLLVEVAITLTTSIFIINVLLHKPVIDALLFSLAIAVGITPQLLPAVVSTSLAAGSREMARRKVLVKRLVCIEDLGDVDVLFTDKTGTLTRAGSASCAVWTSTCRARRCGGAWCATRSPSAAARPWAATSWTWRSGSHRPRSPTGPRSPAISASRRCPSTTNGGWCRCSRTSPAASGC